MEGPGRLVQPPRDPASGQACLPGSVTCLACTICGSSGSWPEAPSRLPCARHVLRKRRQMLTGAQIQRHLGKHETQGNTHGPCPEAAAKVDWDGAPRSALPRGLPPSRPLPQLHDCLRMNCQVMGGGGPVGVSRRGNVLSSPVLAFHTGLLLGAGDLGHQGLVGACCFPPEGQVGLASGQLCWSHRKCLVQRQL